MVTFDGHISKAARITRPGNSLPTLYWTSTDFQAPLENRKPLTTKTHETHTSPRKIIQYEFIDESASIMSPILTQERSPSPSSRSADSPPFTLLLEAVNANPSPVNPSYVLTPPQTPDGSAFKETRKEPNICSLICSQAYSTGIIGFYPELRVNCLMKS